MPFTSDVLSTLLLAFERRFIASPRLGQASYRVTPAHRKWPHRDLMDRCRLWVKGDHFGALARCTLYPQ